MVVIGSGGDAFGGGSKTVLGAGGVAGSIPSAKTRIAPGAVQQTSIKRARPNQGSNIGIPYSRLVPVSTTVGLSKEAPPDGHAHDDATRHRAVGNAAILATSLLRETDNLRAMSLAFILGKPDGTIPYHGHNYTAAFSSAPGLNGVDRFQQLCSFDYLQRYFHHHLRTKVVTLTEDMTEHIFVADEGPFLRGGPCDDGPVTRDHQGQLTDPRQHINEAFNKLETALKEQGLLNWTPDGIVLSKGVNDPSDKLNDEFLEARDGQLYNIRVQGPAITNTWVGDASMEVLPLDKLFVVIVADVVHGSGGPSWESEDAWKTINWNEQMTAVTMEVYNIFTVFGRENTTWQEWKELCEAYKVCWPAFQLALWNNMLKKTLLTNFRVKLTTSSQMVNHSAIRFDNTGNQMCDGVEDEVGRRTDARSRMGLRLGAMAGEYIVGGWCIGSVLDTAASRGTNAGGCHIGVKTAPNTKAVNVNVQTEWWSADRLHRTFMNVEGTTVPRYQAPKPLSGARPWNVPGAHASSRKRQEEADQHDKEQRLRDSLLAPVSTEEEIEEQIKALLDLSRLAAAKPILLDQYTASVSEGPEE